MMLHARTTPATTDGQMTVTALQSLFDHDRQSTRRGRLDVIYDGWCIPKPNRFPAPSIIVKFVVPAITGPLP